MVETENALGTYRQELSRSLGLAEVIALTLSSISPAGSFVLFAPALIASLGGASVMAIVVAATVATCVAVCYGELATIYPIAGGEYTWAARVLGRPLGFGVFLLTLCSGPGVPAMLALGASEYLAAVWPTLHVVGTAVALIVFATTIATLNVRANSWITAGFLALELLVLAGLTALGLMHPTRGMTVFLSPQVVGTSGVLTGVPLYTVVALVPVALLMLAGYQNVVYFAEETAGTDRNLGRAILLSLGAVFAIQLVSLSAVVVGARSLPDLMTASAPISDFARERGGRSVSTAINLGIAIAIVNALIVVINVWARLLFASARDRSWPEAVDRWLATVHHRSHTPVPATIVIGTAAVVASFLPFGWLLIATAEVGILQMGIVGASAMRARRYCQSSERGYRMPVWPVPPLALILVALGLLFQASRDNPAAVALSLVIMTAGITYYYGFIHPRRAERWTLPAAINEESQSSE